MGFDKVAKYYYYPGWHEPGTAFELTVNKQKFEALPAHLQKIIEAAAVTSGTWVHTQFELRNAKVLCSTAGRRCSNQALPERGSEGDERLCG